MRHPTSRLQPDELKPDHRALLEWGFNLQGRVPMNWGIAAQRLARAAALVYARGSESRRVHASAFPRDDDSGMIVPRPSPFTAAELDVLPDVELRST